MSVLSVAEAAEALEVSPRRVRQMIADGQLCGRLVGRSWAIEQADLDQLVTSGAGRPWSAASAWAVLQLAAGDGLAELSPLDRHRARRRLSEHGLLDLVERLRARSMRRPVYAHPGAMDRLVSDDAVVRGGISALADHDVDLVVSDAAEIYVPARDADDVIARYALDPDSDRPNVILHAVPDEAWPFDGKRSAPWPVVAVDLLDAHDERSRRAGRELIERHR